MPPKGRLPTKSRVVGLHGRRPAWSGPHACGPIFADGVTPTGDGCGLGQALTVVTPLIAGPCTSKCSVGVQLHVSASSMPASRGPGRRADRLAPNDPRGELREKLSECIAHDRNNVTGWSVKKRLMMFRNASAGTLYFSGNACTTMTTAPMMLIQNVLLVKMLFGSMGLSFLS